jgi:hypothetical protein
MVTLKTCVSAGGVELSSSELQEKLSKVMLNNTKLNKIVFFIF